MINAASAALMIWWPGEPWGVGNAFFLIGGALAFRATLGATVAAAFAMVISSAAAAGRPPLARVSFSTALTRQR